MQPGKLDRSVIAAAFGIFSIIMQIFTRNYFVLWFGVVLGVVGIIVAAREYKQSQLSEEQNYMAAVAITLAIVGVTLCGLPISVHTVNGIFTRSLNSIVTDLSKLI